MNELTRQGAAKRGYEYIEVADKFRAFHVNYLANERIVFGQLFDEFGVCDRHIYMMAFVLQLSERRGNKRATYLPSQREIVQFTGYKPRTVTVVLKECANMGLVKKIWGPSMAKNGNKRFCRVYYDLDKKGIVVCRRYSELMTKYYRENWASKRVDRKLAEHYREQVQNQETDQGTDDLISRLFPE